jgi:hypothetical protein
MTNNTPLKQQQQYSAAGFRFLLVACFFFPQSRGIPPLLVSNHTLNTCASEDFPFITKMPTTIPLNVGPTEALHVEHHGEADPSFSFMVTVAFTLNYIIGTGFLTLPWGFQVTGVPLGIILLGSLTLFAVSAALCLLEAMARAEAYATSANSFGSMSGLDLGSYRSIALQLRTESDRFLPLKTIDRKRQHVSHTQQAYVIDSSTAIQGTGGKEDPTEKGAELVVGGETFEVSELCKIFLGKSVARAYTLIMAIYLYCSLWAYSTVFANSLAARLPISSFSSASATAYSSDGTAPDDGGLSYGVYLLLFALITLPSSLLELNEQVVVQVALSLCRVAMLTVMITTILAAPIQQGMKTLPGGGDASQIFGPFTPPTTTHTATLLEAVHINKVYLMLPMAAYATIFHHSIPAISHPVKDKKQLGWIYITALGFCFVGYTVLAITVSSYFGENTKISSNLNWEYYWGVIGPNREIPLYARCVSSFVVLLPAFDVASAFPLNAITLGNSLMSWYHGSRVHTLGVQEYRRSVALFRMIAAAPPLCAALFVSNLGVITNFAGVTGFAIAFLFPALLALYSKKLLTAHSVPTHTAYSCWLTSGWMCHLSVALGLFLIVFVAVSLVVMGPPPS